MRKAIDAFLVPSEDLRGKMQNCGLNATLLRHYVDTARYSPVKPYPGDARLLFVGRMNEGKGVDVLLKAFKKILAEFPSAALDLIGEDEKEQTFERLSQQLHINESVVFHGLVPHEATPDFFARASVVILPATWIENSPLVIFEAMASGRPVVAGRIGGIPEIVIDGETGLLCTPGDPDDLSNKLLRLLRDKKLAGEMGIRGRDRVEKHFSLEIHIKGYFDILKKISG
jgi:glycosyltransferase involved in cell wall biosynthesis